MRWAGFCSRVGLIITPQTLQLLTTDNMRIKSGTSLTPLLNSGKSTKEEEKGEVWLLIMTLQLLKQDYNISPEIVNNEQSFLIM